MCNMYIYIYNIYIYIWRSPGRSPRRPGAQSRKREPHTIIVTLSDQHITSFFPELEFYGWLFSLLT